MGIFDTIKSISRKVGTTSTPATRSKRVSSPSGVGGQSRVSSDGGGQSVAVTSGGRVVSGSGSSGGGGGSSGGSSGGGGSSISSSTPVASAQGGGFITAGGDIVRVSTPTAGRQTIASQIKSGRTPQPTAREEALQMSLPASERNLPPQSFYQDESFVDRTPTITEAFRERQRSRDEEVLASEVRSFENELSRIESFQSGEFERLQGLVNRGALSVDQAQSQLESNIDLFKSDIITGYEEKLKARGVFLGGMSTPEGEVFQIITPQTTKSTLSREFGQFFQELEAREFFPAVLSEVVVSTGRLGADVGGLGSGLIFAGSARPGTIQSQFSKGFSRGSGFVERGLDIEGRETGIIGGIATTLPFLPGAVSLAGQSSRTIAGTFRAVRAGRGGEVVSNIGIGARDLSLALSPIKPARARIGLEGAKTLALGSERVFLDSTGNVVKVERTALSSGINRDVSSRIGQVLIPTEEGFKGASIIETKIPKFASNVDDIFGGARTQYSLSVQDIVPTKTKGVFDIVQSDVRLGTITERSPGVFSFDLAKSTEAVTSGRVLSRGASQRIGRDTEFVLGIGGKPARGDVFNVDDFYGGLRKTIRESPDDLGVNIIRPSKDITRTPLSRTFGTQIQEQTLSAEILPGLPNLAKQTFKQSTRTTTQLTGRTTRVVSGVSTNRLNIQQELKQYQTSIPVLSSQLTQKQFSRQRQNILGLNTQSAGTSLAQTPRLANATITAQQLKQSQLLDTATTLKLTPTFPGISGTPFRPRPFILPPAFLSLRQRQGVRSNLLGGRGFRYSPSLTAITFRLFGKPSKRALETGEVTPFETRFLLNGNEKKPNKKKRRKRRRGKDTLGLNYFNKKKRRSII